MGVAQFEISGRADPLDKLPPKPVMRTRGSDHGFDPSVQRGGGGVFRL